MEKRSTLIYNLNVLSFLGSIGVILFCIICRLGVPNTIEIPIINYISTLSLAFVLLFGPSVFRDKHAYLCEYSYIVMLITILLGIGILGGAIVDGLQYGIIALAFIIAFLKRETIHILRIDKKMLSAGMIVLLLMLLLGMGSFALTPLYDIQAAQHRGYMDTLFHISISNMIVNYGVASTGLDGLPFIPYHFGTHFLFGILKRFTGNDIFFFYHISYAVVFIPLFFKYIVLFVYDFCKKYNFEFNYYIVFLIITLLFATSDVILYRSSSLPNHQSTLVSLLFSFVFFGNYLFYASFRGFLTKFYVYLMLFIITLFKISTGLVLVFSLSLVLLYFNRRRSKEIVYIILLSILYIASFYYVMYYNTEVVMYKQDERMEYIKDSLLHFYNYFFGSILVALFIWLYRKEYKEIGGYLLFVVCSNIIGYALFVYVLRDGGNFLIPAYFSAIPLLIVIVNRLVAQWAIKPKYLIFISVLSFVFPYHFYKNVIFQNLWYRNKATESIVDKKKLSLFQLHQEGYFNKYHNVAVYTNNKFADYYFFIPAIIGHPSIFGLPNEAMEDIGWGRDYYKKNRDVSLERAKMKARKLGYEFLLELKETESTYYFVEHPLSNN